MTVINNNGCDPLMEACTLELYRKNIFRVTGLSVDATSKEVSRQVQKLQMLEEMGGGGAVTKAAFALPNPPTSEDIREALSRMKEPEHRVVDEFFWFWPEEFGKSKEDPAIQAILSGDSVAAHQLWETREKSGSHVAQHNMAIFHHMYAVDWTNYHVVADLDEGRDVKIKEHWRKSFQRWEAMIDADDTWDMLKERIRSLDDEALTTGFGRRMLRQLPEALDRVNAEAALKLAEQGRMDWAKFHVDFMRETHQGLDDVDGTSEMVLAPTKKRVEQHLESFQSDVDRAPERGAELATQLLDQCRPMMDLFDLFHGEDAHQRNDLFDKVAQTILQMVIAHQKATGDNKSFVSLLQRALRFASGTTLRERIMKNVSIGEGNLKWGMMQPLLEQLKSVVEGSEKPSQKLKRFQQLIMPKVPNIASEIGVNSSEYNEMMDTLAHALRGISIDAYNDNDDSKTAIAAIQLALKLVVSDDVKKLILGDLNTIEKSTGTASCFFCDHKPGSPKKAIKQPMYKITGRTQHGISYSKNSISVPCCVSCSGSHKRHWVAAGIAAVVVACLGALLAPWASVAGGFSLTILIFWGLLIVGASTSEGQLVALGLMIVGFGGIGTSWGLIEDPIGQIIWVNALGGAVTGTFVTFLIARKMMYEIPPKKLSEMYEPILILEKQGWHLGEKP